MTTATAPSYPVTFDVEYPQELSRWLIFVKIILAIPHLVILYALRIAWQVVTFIAIFIILFTKKYPKELFEFAVNYLRWNANVSSYIGLMRDEYPPFTWDRGQYPVTFEVQYPDELSRWMPLVKWLLAVPHYIILIFLYIGVILAVLVSWFAILFTKKYPQGLFGFVVGVRRWSARVSAYVTLLRDEYPPFSMEP